MTSQDICTRHLLLSHHKEMSTGMAPANPPRSPGQYPHQIKLPEVGADLIIQPGIKLDF